MTSGDGGFLTPLGAAAVGDDDEPRPNRPMRAAGYSHLLSTARDRGEAHEIRNLVAQATGRAARTLRDWNRHGVPPSGVAAVNRATAVWRLGGIQRTADAFGLSVRKTLSWLAGRGRRSRAERDRIERIIYSIGVGVTLLVRVEFNTLTGGLQAESGREVEVILSVHERDIEALDRLVRSGDMGSALQILEPLIYGQYMEEMVDVELTQILTPGPDLWDRADYVLTPEGVVGPGYEH